MRSVSEPYRDRIIRPLGVRTTRGWRLKAYEILYGNVPLHAAVYEDGLVAAARELPQPPVSRGRAGVGFVIFHQGRGVRYLALNWWDRENELFNRVMVRGMQEDDLWVWAREGEVACVWDLQVLGFERDAWVDAVLRNPEAPDVEGYLTRTLTVESGGELEGGAELGLEPEQRGERTPGRSHRGA